MKTKDEWKAERWEGKDFIITGFGNKHCGVFSKVEAEQIVTFLKYVTPLIQQDALNDIQENHIA